MIDYTPAELNMRRLIVIQNHLKGLSDLFEREIAPSLAIHYGILHLVQFLDAYHKLMRALDEQEQGRVLCATYLISGVTKRSDGLRAVRNDWVAHLQGKGRFTEDASDFLRRAGLSGDPSAYYEMMASVIAFVDAAAALLPDTARRAVEKFNRTGDAKPKYHCVDLDRINQNIRARLDAVRERANQKFPGMQWGPSLGSAGARLGPLGPVDMTVGAAGGDGQRKGGGELR